MFLFVFFLLLNLSKYCKSFNRILVQGKEYENKKENYINGKQYYMLQYSRIFLYVQKNSALSPVDVIKSILRFRCAIFLNVAAVFL